MLEMTETAIPSTARSGRTPLENPFVGLFPLDDVAKTFVIKTGRNSVEARRYMRQARQAAKAVNRTARIQLDDAPKGAVTMTVWTIEKRVRKPNAPKAKAPAAKK